MGDLVPGDDGLPAEEVHQWSAAKIKLLCDYVQITSATRKKFLPPQGRGGAAYVDLFSGPGRILVQETGVFSEGGCVAAWVKSVAAGSPFSKVIIGDKDEVRLSAATQRLERLGAPVVALLGPAKDTAFRALQNAAGLGLNFAFLDPYSLGALDFTIITTLAKLQRIDLLVHVSQMDLQRNFDRNAAADVSPLDAFAPGWRDGVDVNQRQRSARQSYFQYWCGLVAAAGVGTNADIRLVTGPGNIPLYLLLLAARHELAHKFWPKVNKADDGQARLL